MFAEDLAQLAQEWADSLVADGYSGLDHRPWYTEGDIMGREEMR